MLDFMYEFPVEKALVPQVETDIGPKSSLAEMEHQKSKVFVNIRKERGMETCNFPPLI